MGDKAQGLHGATPFTQALSSQGSRRCQMPSSPSSALGTAPPQPLFAPGRKILQYKNTGSVPLALTIPQLRDVGQVTPPL